MTKRWSVGFLVLAMSAAVAAPAEAGGKGKVQRAASLSRNRDGVVFNENFAHHQGIRRVLSAGVLGRTMKLENTQNADGIRTTLGRGRIRPPEKVTHTTTGIAQGTRSQATHKKRGLLMRFMNRQTISRTDDVTLGQNGAPDVAESETSKHRFNLLRNVGSVKEVETSRMEIDTETGQDDMGGVIEKLDHQGNLTAEPRATGGRRWGKAFKAKLEGFREVVNTPQGPEVTETYTMKYGFWRMVKKGLTLGLADGGGKAVTIEHTQDAFGTRVKMTTPKETITRSTEILDGRTVSNGTFRRKGFWSTKNEKDTVEIDSQKGVHTVEKQRNEDGTTSRAITTTQFVDGARAVERETSGKYKIRASSPRQGGGKNWMRSRQGKYFKWQYGRHNGNFHARFDTPWFNLGKTVFVYNEKTGEVSNVPADELAEDYEVEDGDEGDYATR